MTITEEQFSGEMDILESLPPFLDGKKAASRRLAMLDALEEFEYGVVRQARKEYLQDNSRETTFFPTPGIIRGLCLDILEKRQREKEYVKSMPVYEPMEHVCSPIKPEMNSTWKWLALIAPYEARHILCDAKVSVCPQCGKQHEKEHPLIVGFRTYIDPETKQNSFPLEDTKDWKLWAKGLSLCKECDARAVEEKHATK